MSAMVSARFAGSDRSGGLGRPWATSQKLQRRVQTSPRIMKVAVPWPKHSWMFGQLASSQTVTRRLARSFDFSAATAPVDGIRTRIHDGLRSTGASTNSTGERPILSPATCFTPGTSEAGASFTTDSGMDLEVAGVSDISFATDLHGWERIYADGAGRQETGRGGNSFTGIRYIRGNPRSIRENPWQKALLPRPRPEQAGAARQAPRPGGPGRLRGWRDRRSLAPRSLPARRSRRG